MYKFRIYIPSIGRAEEQITLKFLLDRLPNLADKITILTSEKELETYRDMWSLYCDIITVPEILGKGIHVARQYALDYHLDNFFDEPYAIMIDDDMVFARREFGSVKLNECNSSDLTVMFRMITDWLDAGIPLVGISARQGNNNHEEDYSDATRQMNFHATQPQALRSNGIRFDEIEVMEDFNVVLSLLSKGSSNRVSNEFCWNQKGSGAKGGCSEYRDAELQARCAEMLADRYPDFVTVVEKKSKSVWKGMQTRKDVRIQWKKAYKKGLETL